MTLKHDDEELLKFRAGTKVSSIFVSCGSLPGIRIDQIEGYVVTVDYAKHLL